MLKKTNGYAKFAMYVLVIVASIAAAAGLLRGKVNTMDIDGCKPAQLHKTEIAVLEVQLEVQLAHIRGDVAEIKADIKELLKAHDKQ